MVVGGVSKGHPVDERFEGKTDLLNTVMHDARFQLPTRVPCREYLRGAKHHGAMSLFREMAQGFSPMLRGSMMVHISEKLMYGVYYFTDAPNGFVIDAAQRLYGE